MQIAIIHYHLNRGGVSQVIANHLAALATLPQSQRPAKVAILYCGSHDGWPENVWAGTRWEHAPPFEVPLVPVPAIGYDTSVACESSQLAATLRAELANQGLPPSDTILHAHNHSLGKNASVPGALRELAADGYRLLLQVHDFAEDFRPANYRHLMRATGANDPDELSVLLYPAGPGIRYATLNARDQQVMAQAGAEQLDLLPNPVDDFPELPAVDEAAARVRRKLGLPEGQPLVVYPVRGIRRKNIGELLLHAALAGGDICFAVTLAPENPAELVSFDRWIELSEELGLNCRLGIGKAGPGRRGVDFLDALAGADALITTSLAEGFGMVFLEAWLAGKPLLGRNLPEITADFVNSGIQYPGLRDTLRVPADWFDLPAARREVQELHAWACRDFGLAPPTEPPPADWMNGENGVDFATLPQRFQAEAIRHVSTMPALCRDQIEALNPGYQQQFDADQLGAGQDIFSNASAVRRHYSPEGVGLRLHAVYETLLEGPAGEPIGSLPGRESILPYFLRLDRIHPVRLEP